MNKNKFLARAIFWFCILVFALIVGLFPQQLQKSGPVNGSGAEEAVMKDPAAGLGADGPAVSGPKKSGSEEEEKKAGPKKEAEAGIKEPKADPVAATETKPVPAPQKPAAGAESENPKAVTEKKKPAPKAKPGEEKGPGAEKPAPKADSGVENPKPELSV